MRGHAVRVHEDLHHARLPADDIGPRHVRHACQPLRDLLGHAAQGAAVGRCAGKREGHHGHVVDLDRLDDPAADARRNDVQILAEFLLKLDQASLAVFAHVVANRDDRLVLAAHRVDVLDAVDLIEDLFQGRGDQLLDFGRRMAGEIDVDIGQRHDDLRVFLARRQSQGRQADDRCQQDQNEREVRFQEDLHDPIREAVFLACADAGMLSHGWPPATMATRRAATGQLGGGAAGFDPAGNTTCSP